MAQYSYAATVPRE